MLIRRLALVALLSGGLVGLLGTAAWAHPSPSPTPTATARTRPPQPAKCTETVVGATVSCYFRHGKWHAVYDARGQDGGFGDGGSGGGIPAGFIVFFFLLFIGGIAFSIWRFSTTRRLAKDAGLSDGDATALAVFGGDAGLAAAYVGSEVRKHQNQPAAPTTPSTPDAGDGDNLATKRSAAERLAELQSLHDQGLIGVEEFNRRRAAILDGI